MLFSKKSPKQTIHVEYVTHRRAD